MRDRGRGQIKIRGAHTVFKNSPILRGSRFKSQLGVCVVLSDCTSCLQRWFPLQFHFYS